MAESLTLQLAHHIRALRRSRQWTLDQMAGQCGVSRATLSRIEKAEVSPTAETLSRVCGAFELPVSRLLAMTETQFLALVPFDEQPEWEDPETGYARRAVSPASPALTGQVHECHLPPDTIATEAAPDRSGQEHHLIVLDGAMTVHVDGVSHELTAEDCLRFRMYDESRFETGPSRGARYLLIQV